MQYLTNSDVFRHSVYPSIAKSPHFRTSDFDDLLTIQNCAKFSSNTINIFTMKSFSIFIVALFAVAAKADNRLLQTAAPVAVPVAVVPVAVPVAAGTSSSSVKSASSSKSSRRKLQTVAPVAVPVAVVPVAVPVAAGTASSVKSASSSKSSRRTL